MVRPKIWPRLAGLWRGWRDLLNRAFWHVARDRTKAIEPLFPDSIGERIDEAGDIRLRYFGQRGDHLF